MRADGDIRKECVSPRAAPVFGEMKAQGPWILEAAYRKCRAAPRPVGVPPCEWEEGLQIAVMEFLARPPERMHPKLLWLRARSRCLDSAAKPRGLPLQEWMIAREAPDRSASRGELDALWGAARFLLSDRLFETFRVWLHHGCRMGDTAHALDLQRATLRQRVRRIRQNLGAYPLAG